MGQKKKKEGKDGKKTQKIGGKGKNCLLQLINESMEEHGKQRTSQSAVYRIYAEQVCHDNTDTDQHRH